MKAPAIKMLKTFVPKPAKPIVPAREILPKPAQQPRVKMIKPPKPLEPKTPPRLKSPALGALTGMLQLESAAGRWHRDMTHEERAAYARANPDSPFVRNADARSNLSARTVAR